MRKKEKRNEKKKKIKKKKDPRDVNKIKYNLTVRITLKLDRRS